jgi:transposase, IS5 family
LAEGDSMRPRERRDSGQNDLFKARLDQIVDTDHALAKLGRVIDWRFLEERFGAVYSDKAGHPPLPTRLMAGLSILKHMHNLSDEDLCARWVENPYYQLFCGEEFFQHKLTFDRSSLTRWRQRMGEEKLVALIQESLAVATRTGAARPADFSKVIVDTTVQPKAVAFPTDAKLMHRARERLVRLARTTGVDLRQSYERVGKHALIAHQRYAHAKQFKRANRALKTLRTYLGRVTRDIVRKIRGEAELESVFAHPLMRARRVRDQRHHQRGKKVYSLHAPEVECIGKGKAHRPYEFGVKVSLATTLHRSGAASSSPTPRRCPATPMTAIRSPPSSRRSRRRSAPTSLASSPTAAIAATTPRPTTLSRSTSPARDAASPRRSNVNSAAARRSNRSLDTPSPSTAWAGTISPAPTGEARYCGED